MNHAVLGTALAAMLCASLPADGKFPLFAESETTFAVMSGAPTIFRKDASGAVTGFTIHTVEGAQEFERKR